MKLKINEYYLIEYHDAAYLYASQLEASGGIIVLPPKNVSIGVAEKVESDWIRLRLDSCAIVEQADSTIVVPEIAVPKRKNKLITIPVDAIICAVRISFPDILNIDLKKGREMFDEEGLTSTVVIGQKKNLFNGVKKGQSIGVNWNDVRIATKSPKLKTGPSPMYLEGLYMGVSDEYLLVHNPENINLETVKNHPFKKADLFYVPLTMVTKVEILDIRESATPEYEFIAPQSEFNSVLGNNIFSVIEAEDGYVVGFPNDTNDQLRMYATIKHTGFEDEIMINLKEIRARADHSF